MLSCAVSNLAKRGSILRHTSRQLIGKVSKPALIVSSVNTQQQQQQHHQQQRFVHIEKKLEELGIELPPASGPKANYDICCFAQNESMLYLSGHLPVKADGTAVTGKIGGDGGKSVDHGYDGARTAGLAILSTLKDKLGDLDRVEQVVKILGLVQSDDTFKEQHLVMNGCSDLLVEVFGKTTGFHARSAVGVNTLPLDVSVEIEAVVQVKPAK